MGEAPTTAARSVQDRPQSTMVIAADYLRACFRRRPRSLCVHRSILSKIVWKFPPASRSLSIPALLFFLTVGGVGPLFGGEQAPLQERATMPKAGISAPSTVPTRFIKHTTSGGEKKKTRIVLSPEEQAWLVAHPGITFGYTDQFEPAVIVNEDGSYRGTLVDFLELMNSAPWNRF